MPGQPDVEHHQVEPAGHRVVVGRRSVGDDGGGEPVGRAALLDERRRSAARPRRSGCGSSRPPRLAGIDDREGGAAAGHAVQQHLAAVRDGDGADDRQPEPGAVARGGRAAPPRANRSKIRVRSAASTPGPVSATQNRSQPPASWEPTPIQSPASVWRQALSASATSAWVIRCGSSRRVDSGGGLERQVAVAEPREASRTTSPVSSRESTRAGCRNDGCSARASSSRSETMRFIRLQLVVDQRDRGFDVGGSVGSSTSRWPRTMVIGVRSSWPDVVDEAALRRDAGLDAVEHSVDGADDLVEFVAVPAWRECASTGRCR